MKKTLLTILAALVCATGVLASDEFSLTAETPAKGTMPRKPQPSMLKFYGFFRNFTIVDSREVNAGKHDLYYYMPKDRVLNSAGEDMNEGFNWKSVSLTTRLGLEIKGYKYGDMNITGKVEADFYSLDGKEASNTVSQMRMRLAYITMAWEKAALTLGQNWHPIAVDLPHAISLEVGAPFNPFNRSPQLTFDYTAGKFKFTASALYLSQYLPTGPNGKSAEYFKYGLPDFYLGFSFKSGAFYGKAGVDIVNTRPFRIAYGPGKISSYKDESTGELHNDPYKVSGLLSAASPFVFLQYTKDNFQVKAKSVYASSGEHLNLLSGYGIKGMYQNGTVYKYTPMRDWASFVSFQYGKKVQVLGLIGYMKQLGTADRLYTTLSAPNQSANYSQFLYLNGAADNKIQQAWRVTPTIVWNIGKLAIALEYDCTSAQFGNDNSLRTPNGTFRSSDCHWITNHRILNMVRFTF